MRDIPPSFPFDRRWLRNAFEGSRARSLTAAPPGGAGVAVATWRVRVAFDGCRCGRVDRRDSQGAFWDAPWKRARWSERVGTCGYRFREETSSVEHPGGWHQRDARIPWVNIITLYWQARASRSFSLISLEFPSSSSSRRDFLFSPWDSRLPVRWRKLERRVGSFRTGEPARFRTHERTRARVSFASRVNSRSSRRSRSYRLLARIYIRGVKMNSASFIDIFDRYDR